ncbi:hypothetical protein DMA11_19195 [Marinilabiliaceae bacterium JC017]|nr:hypothetical protein DMA11_19195 [Marinilabiliaceae bacterium JC017]
MVIRLKGKISNMKVYSIITLCQLFICLTLHAQSYTYEFNDTHLYLEQNFGIIAKIYDRENKLLYTEFTNKGSHESNQIEGMFNFQKLPMPILKRVNAICILLTDTANNNLDSLCSNTIRDVIDQAIVNKVQAKRLLAIENSMIELGQLNDVTFWYNGELVTYGVVKHNGRYWMDRNLGASQRAESLRDTLAYGDVFQWGRAADGHQLVDEITTTKELVPSGKQPWHNAFIFNKNPDWNEDASWTKRWYNGSPNMEYSTNVCPDGWHVPSSYEWELAMSGWRNKQDAFNSPLKLPSAIPLRNPTQITKRNKLSTAYSIHYWSSTSGVNKGSATATFMSNSIVRLFNVYARRSGYPVRCIKDKRELSQ